LGYAPEVVCHPRPRITQTDDDLGRPRFTVVAMPRVRDASLIRASTTHIDPTWADGRTTAIQRTGIGNTDIFTNVEPLR